jgi:hypothetical protein
MLDILYLVVVLGGFALLSLGLVALCEKLMGEG